MKKRLPAILALLFVFAVGQSLGAQGKGKVLMILRPGDQDAADLMLTKEVGVMKSTLDATGLHGRCRNCHRAAH